ncbi:MAG: acyl-CoA dehydrogenase family protein [Acidimicrobiia bacterium]
MRFAFTDDQLEFRDAVRDFLDKECGPAQVRAAWEEPTGRVPGLWAKLTDLGVTTATAPEDRGGLGMQEVDLVLILEETGRAALPEPVVEHVAVALPLFGDADERTFGAQLLDGFVPYADTCDAFLLARDGELHLVERDIVALETRESVDGARRLFSFDWTASEATRVGGTDELALALDRGALATAAQLCGLADRMIAMTVDYAKERRQFGVPIGTFQAVKHQLANARLQLEFARPLVYRASYSVAHRDPGRSTHVSMAKAFCSDAAALAGRVALQCHGAIAHTVEYDLHLYLKRSWALERAWGDAAWHRRRVAGSVL